MRYLLILLMVLPLMGFTFLDPIARKNQEGNKLFQEEKFQEALERYREAQVEGRDLPELHFNTGNTLYKLRAYDKALQEFDRTLDSKDPSLLSDAYYSIGNAYFSQKSFQEAVEAYKNSLDLRPDDPDAKIQLKRALDLAKKQEQNQQGQQDQQGEQDQEGEQNPQGQQDEQGQQNQDPQGQQDEHGQQNQDPQDEQGQQNQDPQNEQGQQDRPEDQEKGQPPSPQPGELTQEEAERILDALKTQEADAQKRRRVRLSGRRYRGEEW